MRRATLSFETTFTATIGCTLSGCHNLICNSSSKWYDWALSVFAPFSGVRLKLWFFPGQRSKDDQSTDLVQSQSVPKVDVQYDQLFGTDKEAADAAREITGLMVSNETSKALIACDRMLSLYPGNRLFEGLRLEVENK